MNVILGEQLLTSTERPIEINYFLLYFIDSAKTLRRRPWPTPLRRGARGWGTLSQQNNAAEGGNGSIMVGMFVCLYLTSQKLSEREFFVSARMENGLRC